ncbi:MAG: hypothetical protein AAFQ36_04125 [Pseudomonadota bacterium]
MLALLFTVFTATTAIAQDKPYAELVQSIVDSELQAWIDDPDLIFAINEQNEINDGMSMLRIEGLDKRWISQDGAGPMIWDLLDRQASILMRERRELSNGVITEIILMDAFGLNVAISDPTSDYYQGDEAKYQDTYLVGPNAIHISDIEFDDSTQQWQTQVSKTVLDPETGQPIGAITFGINADAIPQ